VNILAKYGTYDYCFDVRFEREVQDVRIAHVFKTLAGVELGGTTLRSPPIPLRPPRPGNWRGCAFASAACSTPAPTWPTRGVGA